jgi:hypothetical protein
MVNLSNSPTSHKPDVTVVSTGDNPADWRRWWAVESDRVGSDWPSVIGLHLTIVDQLRDADDADAQVGCSS